MDNNFFSEKEIKGLKAITLEELRELCNDISYEIKSLENEESGKCDLEKIGRLYHKVTGTAGMVGLMDISELASEGEHLAGADNMEEGDALEKLVSITKRFNEFLEASEEELS